MSDIIVSDTVIVGGGIAGLYACYKLKQLKGDNHTIALFEGTNRFGGRIETVEMGGFLAEYGPMRFEKMAQPLLMELIAELGLETNHFAPYTAANDPDSLFDLALAEAELISCFGIRDWSREPFEAGCHIWKAGVRVEEAIKELNAFSLHGAPPSNKNIHICGEAYSDFQGFIEGGLRTALNVLKYII